MSEAATPAETSEAPITPPPEGTSGAALATPADAPEASGSWLDRLDADLRSEPTLQRYKTESDAAKALLEQRRKLSEKGLILPKADASPEDVRAAMTEIGCPETPEGYDLGEFALPEGMAWNEEGQREALELMHHVGLTSDQVKPLMQWVAESGQRKQQEAAQADADRHSEWDQELMHQWGTAADKRYELAERAAKMGLGEDAHSIANARLPDGGLLKHHPGFRDMLAEVGQLMAEHGKLGDSQPSNFTATPDGAKQRISEFEADPLKVKALFDNTDPGHKMAAEEWKRLHEQAYPGKPSTGASTAVEIAT